jgi:hypothetical protein
MKDFDSKTIRWVKSVLALALLVCLWDMPYGYYQLVRFVGMVIFIGVAIVEFEEKRLWSIIWLSSALLINPIFKISLGRDMWNIVDVAWAVLLGSSVVMDRKGKQ